MFTINEKLSFCCYSTSKIYKISSKAPGPWFINISCNNQALVLMPNAKDFFFFLFITILWIFVWNRYFITMQMKERKESKYFLIIFKNLFICLEKESYNIQMHIHICIWIIRTLYISKNCSIFRNKHSAASFLYVQNPVIYYRWRKIRTLCYLSGLNISRIWSTTDTTSLFTHDKGSLVVPILACSLITD